MSLAESQQQHANDVARSSISWCGACSYLICPLMVSNDSLVPR